MARWNWSCDHLRWNIRNLKRVNWSDENRYLLRLVDGRVRVWRHRNTAFHVGNVMGTTAFDGGGETVWGSFLLIVSCTCMSYNVTSMALHTVTTCSAHTLHPILIIIHWLTGKSLWKITPDRTELALWENADNKRRLTHFIGLPCPLIWTQSSTYGALLAVRWTNIIHDVKILLN